MDTNILEKKNYIRFNGNFFGMKPILGLYFFPERETEKE